MKRRTLFETVANYFEKTGFVVKVVFFTLNWIVVMIE